MSNPNREINNDQLQSCSKRPDELIYNSTLMKQMCNGFARSELFRDKVLATPDEVLEYSRMQCVCLHVSECLYNYLGTYASQVRFKARS